MRPCSFPPAPHHFGFHTVWYKLLALSPPVGRFSSFFIIISAYYNSQLLKLAISQQTGYDSVSQQLYIEENPIDKTSDFSSLAENLILLVAGETRVKMTPPENTLLVNDIHNLSNNFLTDVKVCYNKIHPNIESGNVYRHLHPSSGILKVIGVEDGYLKVDFLRCFNLMLYLGYF